jgi:hypothetical protein
MIEEYIIQVFVNKFEENFRDHRKRGRESNEKRNMI